LKVYPDNYTDNSFFKDVLGTRFGSLESEKIIIGYPEPESEKIGSLELEKSGRSLQVHTGYLTFSLKKTLLIINC